MDDVQLVNHGDKHFDPEVYIENYYKNFQPDDSDPDRKLFKFIYDSLHEIFKRGKITGDRLLDIGTGPVSHTVYAASKWFREITLSDISEANLNVLKSWKAGERLFLDGLFNYVISLAEETEDVVTANRRLSNQVKSIVSCDLREKNMFAGTEVEGVMFDAVILSLSQSVAVSSYNDFTNNVKNYTKYLRSGGHVIAFDALGDTYYKCGQYKFRAASMKKEEVIAAYKECGYEIISWTERNDLYDPTALANGDKTGCFALVGRKL